MSFGVQKTCTHTLKIKSRIQLKAPKTSHCLVPRHYWAVFFFETEQGVAVTVHGDLYRAMFNKFLFTKIEEEDNGNIWFQ